MHLHKRGAGAPSPPPTTFAREGQPRHRVSVAMEGSPEPGTRGSQTHSQASTELSTASSEMEHYAKLPPESAGGPRVHQRGAQT